MTDIPSVVAIFPKLVPDARRLAICSLCCWVTLFLHSRRRIGDLPSGDKRKELRDSNPLGKQKKAPHFHVALVVVDFILHSSYRLVDQIAVLSNDMLVYNQLRAPTIDTDSYIKVERCFSSAQANHNIITHTFKQKLVTRSDIRLRHMLNFKWEHGRMMNNLLPCHIFVRGTL